MDFNDPMLNELVDKITKGLREGNRDEAARYMDIVIEQYPEVANILMQSVEFQNIMAENEEAVMEEEKAQEAQIPIQNRTDEERQAAEQERMINDMNAMLEKDPETGKAKNRLDVIKRELKLNPAINLRICNTGLNYNEFRSMYYLKRDKYSNLTTDQLKLLSNKVLYRFQDQCELQAKQWEDKIREIKEVAELKGWDVTRDID